MPYSPPLSRVFCRVVDRCGEVTWRSAVGVDRQKNETIRDVLEKFRAASGANLQDQLSVLAADGARYSLQLNVEAVSVLQDGDVVVAEAEMPQNMFRDASSASNSGTRIASPGVGPSDCPSTDEGSSSPYSYEYSTASEYSVRDGSSQSPAVSHRSRRSRSGTDRDTRHFDRPRFVRSKSRISDRRCCSDGVRKPEARDARGDRNSSFASHRSSRQARPTRAPRWGHCGLSRTVRRSASIADGERPPRRRHRSRFRRTSRTPHRDSRSRTPLPRRNCHSPGRATRPRSQQRPAQRGHYLTTQEIGDNSAKKSVFALISDRAGATRPPSQQRPAQRAHYLTTQEIGDRSARKSVFPLINDKVGDVGVTQPFKRVIRGSAGNVVKSEVINGEDLREVGSVSLFWAMQNSGNPILCVFRRDAGHVTDAMMDASWYLDNCLTIKEFEDDPPDTGVKAVMPEGTWWIHGRATTKSGKSVEAIGVGSNRKKRASAARLALALAAALSEVTEENRKSLFLEGSAFERAVDSAKDAVGTSQARAVS